MKSYSSFESVCNDAGNFRSEADLRQAFARALKRELRKSPCNKYVVEQWLIPAVSEWLRGGGPDIRVSTLIVEFRSPRSGVGAGVEQLKEHMRGLYEEIEGRAAVYGLVTDGVEAVAYKYDGGFREISRGSMPEVARALLTAFCSDKIPVVRPEDLVKIFGV